MQALFARIFLATQEVSATATGELRPKAAGVVAMSVVTNVLLVCSVAESVEDEDGIDWVPAITDLQSLLRDAGLPVLTRLDGFTGGNKAMEATVFGGAYDRGIDRAFRYAVACCAWQRPDELQLFVKQQSDDIFSLFMLRDGAMVAVYGPALEGGW